MIYSPLRFISSSMSRFFVVIVIKLAKLPALWKTRTFISGWAWIAWKRATDFAGRTGDSG